VIQKSWIYTSLGDVPDGEIPRMFHDSVNMSPGELRAWAKNPWHKLASTSTGLASLRRIPGLLERQISDWTAADYKFARKVLGFNKRHLTGKTHNLFGKPARAGVPWSKRAIALKNWGHDPSKPSSPAFEEHREWLKEHGRKSNPRRSKKNLIDIDAMVKAIEEGRDPSDVMFRTEPRQNCEGLTRAECAEMQRDFLAEKKRRASKQPKPRGKRRAAPRAAPGHKQDLRFAKQLRSTDFTAQHKRDERAMLQHIEAAQKAMRVLVKQVAPLAAKAKATAKKKNTKPEGELMKLLREDPKAQEFVKIFVGEESDFKSSKSWRNTALYRVRDAALGKLSLKDALEAISPIKAPPGSKTPSGARKVWNRTPTASTLGKGFMWSSLARGPESTSEPGQHSLRTRFPPEVLEYLPSTVALAVGRGQVGLPRVVEEITDRFKNQRDTFAKKRLEQKNLLVQMPYIRTKVVQDLTNPDEMTALAAAATLLMQETGIRPSDVGSTKPLPLTAPQQVSRGDEVVLERQPEDGSDTLSRKRGTVQKVVGKNVVVRVGSEEVSLPWDDKRLKQERPIYGAVNLAPEHVKVGKSGVKLAFRGKHGVDNVAAADHAELTEVLTEYKQRAEGANLPQLFVTSRGELLTKSKLDQYLKENFPEVSATHFRKLRATAEIRQSLKDGLATAQPKLRKARGDSQREEIVLDVVKDAFRRGQEALSHEGGDTTINAYVNPGVLLRFLTEGGFRDGENLGQMLMTDRPLALNYSPSAFAR